MLSDVHRRTDLKHGIDIFVLARINISRKLEVPEHISDAVIAHPVTRTEILMRVVVKETPSERAADIVVRHNAVQNVAVS